MSEIKPPCYNCTKRCVGCHATCQGYKNYKKENDEINKKMREEGSLNYFSLPSRRKRHKHGGI